MKLFLIENAYEYEQGCKNQRDDNTPVDGILYFDFFLHNITYSSFYNRNYISPFYQNTDWMTMKNKQFIVEK